MESMNKTNKLGSQWSLGWGSEKETQTKTSSKVIKYHNESQLKFQEKVGVAESQENVKRDEKRKKTDSFNQKLPTFNPKEGGKTNIVLGDAPTDYRKKDEVFTNENMKSKKKC